LAEVSQTIIIIIIIIITPSGTIGSPLFHSSDPKKAETIETVDGKVENERGRERK